MQRYAQGKKYIDRLQEFFSTAHLKLQAVTDIKDEEVVVCHSNMVRDVVDRPQ